MKNITHTTLLVLTALALLGAAGRVRADATTGTYSVRDFGAKGDGTTPDTAAINAAITAAAAAGGGTVRFPAGTYLSGSVHLKSDITLYLDSGATLLGGAPADGVTYDAPEDNPAAGNYEDFGHAHWHNSLIWGDGLHDIAILGPGRIYGRGLARDYPSVGMGNKSIALKLCRNVTLRDFTIQHGGWFGILATGVDNFTISGLREDTNRDGMDIDCCRSVRVSDCTINSPLDDGICLKSSYGLGFVRATENVTITGCQVSGFDEGTLLDGTFGRTGRGHTGRIKFGTEANGGFKNITISSCIFNFCQGLALEEVDGGDLEDVAITDITMRDPVSAPFYIRLGARLRGPAPVPPGSLHRVTISHVVVYNAPAGQGAIIAGIPGNPVQDVTLSDIHFYFAGGGTKAQAAITPPEDITGYPEPGRVGVTPGYGFFIRHAQNIDLDGIYLHTMTPDQRPAFALDDVSALDISRLTAQQAPGTALFASKGVTGLVQHK